MIKSRSVALLLAWLAIAGAMGCSGRTSSETKNALDARQKEVDQRIAAAPDSDGEPVARWFLPQVLREISGLALTADGRVLAHNDERGRVYVIDPRRGVILKQFSVGEKGVAGDFEGIAVAENDIFLLESNGNVYQFREGEDKDNVQFTLHDTKLGKECEFEGIAIERGTRAFLLACKIISKKSLRNQLMIYRWLPRPGGKPLVSSISVSLAEAVGGNGWKTLHPSDLTIDPGSGNYVVISGREKALIEITPQGAVVRSITIPGDPQQPEGVAITPDGLLIIGDEGVTRAADLTLYPWRRAAGSTTPPATDTARAGAAADSSIR